MIFLLAGIVCLAFAVETLLGFGGTLVALSIGATWWPVDELVDMLVPVNLVVSLYMCVRLRAFFEPRLFFLRVLPFILLGMALGLLALPWLTAVAGLEAILGGFLVMLASRELSQSPAVSPEDDAVRPSSGNQYRLGVPIAFGMGGLIHSLLATGGPFIVLGLQPLRLSPELQRVTLAALWLLLNALLIFWRFQNGLTTLQNLEDSLWLLPGVVGGILLGEWLAVRVRGGSFRRLVWLVLLAAGIKLLLKAWA
jgi:uncharacterized membrane protein YfcA